MLLSLCLPSQGRAENVNGYGEFIVLNSALWLESYLEHELLELTVRESKDEARTAAVRDLAKAARAVGELAIDETINQRGGFLEVSHRFRADSIVKFHPQSSGVFDLPGSPTPRFAVTGDALWSPVIFNLDLISDPERFTYARALRLWIHELGHKIPHDKGLTDRVAVDISRRYGGQVQIAGGLIVLNGTPFTAPGGDLSSPITGHWPTRKWNRVALVRDGQLHDVTSSFNAQLDALLRPTLKYYEMDRIVRNVRSAGDGKFEADVQIFRHPRDLSQYALDEIGGPYKKRLRFELHSRSPFLHVLEYGDARQPLNRVPDSSFEILKLIVDGRKISGVLRLKSFVERYFHSASYPVNHGAQLVLRSGTRQTEVPLEIRVDMNSDWGLMPGEIYRRESSRDGHFHGELPADWPATFEVTGLIDTFMGLGPWTTYTSVAMIVTPERPYRHGCDEQLLLVGSNQLTD